MPAVSELQKFESKKTIFWQVFRLNHLYSLTPAAFLAFYPQFSSFSQGVVLPEYLRQANARFSDFGEDAEEARRLFVAHKLTLYSASTPPEGVTPTPAILATAGRGAMQEVASKKVSIQYC